MDVAVVKWQFNPLAVTTAYPFIVSALHSMYMLQPDSGVPFVLPVPLWSTPVLLHFKIPISVDVTLSRCMAWDPASRTWGMQGLAVMWVVQDPSTLQTTFVCGGLRGGDLTVMEMKQGVIVHPRPHRNIIPGLKGVYAPRTYSGVIASGILIAFVTVMWFATWHYERQHRFTDATDLSRLRLKHILLFGEVQPDIGRDFIHLDKEITDAELAPTRRDLIVSPLCLFA